MKEGWKYVKLGEVASYINGFAFKPDDWCTEGKPIIRIQTLTESRGTTNRCNRTDIPEKYNVVAGDILISWSATLGVYEWKGEDAFLNQHIFKVVFDKTDIDKYYLKYVVESSLAEMSNRTNGATMKHIRKGDFDNTLIPLPPLPEQERIVTYLDSAFAKIDALKTNAEKMLDEAKALFAAALKEAMTPQEGWEEKTLGEIATDFYRGSGIKRDQVTQTGIPCVRYGEIYTTYNYSFDNCVSHTIEENIKSRKYFSHGDILFAITGESVEEIGKCIAYTGKESCLCGGDIALMKHNQNAKYLAYALSTPDAIKQKGAGKTKLKVVHTNIPSLKEISIPLPTLETQRTIAEHLDTLSGKVRQLEDNYKKTISECDAMKQAILRETFE